MDACYGCTVAIGFSKPKRSVVALGLRLALTSVREYLKNVPFLRWLAPLRGDSHGSTSDFPREHGKSLVLPWELKFRSKPGRYLIMNNIKLISPEQWEYFLSTRGVDTSIALPLIDYSLNLSKKKLPVIFEVEHLSKILRVPRETLNSMINGVDSYYREFELPKRTGGVRVIKAPYSSLMAVQYWIKNTILDRQYIHSASHGFTSGRSIKTHAELHSKSKFILKIDIKDYFPSFSVNWVANYFHSIGYAPNVAFYLASLITDGKSLVQGAPTSPVMSNILFRRADRALQRLADSYGLIYSRYADDICFSGDFVPRKLERLVGRILNSFHFSINNKKTFFGPVEGTYITGLKILDGRVRVPRVLKRHLRKEVYFIRKFGLISHLNKKRIRDSSYLSRLRGQVSFWAYIEPDDEYAADAMKALKDL